MENIHHTFIYRNIQLPFIRNMLFVVLYIYVCMRNKLEKEDNATQREITFSSKLHLKSEECHVFSRAQKLSGND